MSMEDWLKKSNTMEFDLLVRRNTSPSAAVKELAMRSILHPAFLQFRNREMVSSHVFRHSCIL